MNGDLLILLAFLLGVLFSLFHRDYLRKRLITKVDVLDHEEVKARVGEIEVRINDQEKRIVKIELVARVEKVTT